MMGRFALTRDASDIVRVGVVGGFLSCIDCALVGAALPSMRTDLGLSDGRLSLFVSLSVAGMMLASLGGRRVLQGLGLKAFAYCSLRMDSRYDIIEVTLKEEVSP